MNNSKWTRRRAIKATGALGLIPLLGLGSDETMLHRSIPGTNETLPVIGLGTYDVFDVDSTPETISARQEIVDALTHSGGNVIDTSPMYNRSEAVIGDIIEAGTPRQDLFLATKVWTSGRESGVSQMRRSAEMMNTKIIDLMQVHNLRDTAVHMETIRQWQDEGRIRYNGLTHYRASAHDSA